MGRTRTDDELRPKAGFTLTRRVAPAGFGESS